MITNRIRQKKDKKITLKKITLRRARIFDFVDLFVFLLWLACILIVLVILKGGV